MRRLWFLAFVRACAAFSARNRNISRRRSPQHPDGDDAQQKVAVLGKALRVIYQQGGTLAVLRRSDGMQNYPAETLVRAALEASQGDKGMASGILNSMLGSCCSSNEQDDDTNEDRKSRAHLACSLMRAYDDPKTELEPDLVSLSLAYYAACEHDLLSDRAQGFLRRAECFYEDPLGETSKHSKRTHMSPSKMNPNWDEIQQKYNIQLLQDSDEFVVISKPSGMVCYHASSKTSSRVKPKQQTKEPSLETCLLQNGVPLSTLNQQGRGFVHHLDRGTCGCMVLAKTNRMHAILVAQFFLRRVSKTYQALVVISDRTIQSNLPQHVTFDIDGRPSESEFRIRKPIGSLAMRVRVRTEQGRRHQVRIHCSRGLHAPILLDSLYGGLALLSKLKNIRNSLLHDWSLFVQRINSA